ncbi:patatin-like phospholipase family protein [Paracraurococcus lichenis]|uniref:Patatin-like phospholipase family protein n=1 Tax=Paracraurococcus lichenis TaxID=3064888 RepID=A0ABT9E3R8_9PROT|nr:patatin-like phospholipase family protein [Paracraurococcus sp. LOR1-02]MDO9710815.1 patatin-like phospholipase family protein [Paracraurococcus sp. LOR1-02]
MDGTMGQGAPRAPQQVVLVLQGGGALGAYQAGVFEALHEAGVEPDWVIGTSIGAINAGIIAGNTAEDRLPRLREFWARVAHHPLVEAWTALPGFGGVVPRCATLASGVTGFFRPNPAAFLGWQVPLTAERAGYYSTAPLAATLAGLIDPARLNAGAPRLTVGAANVRTGEMRYFDSRGTPLGLPHILASGALPPAFPAVRIEGELWWDGGILSNTPVECVFDDQPRRDSLVFAVHIWNPQGPEPETIAQVMHRQKDLQYASRAATHIRRQQQMHRLRHVINELSAMLPPALREEPRARDLAAYGCPTVMHVVRLLAPGLDNEDHAKDIDFSRAGIRARWEAGLVDTRRALEGRPWERLADPLEGFVLHELRREAMPVPG